ALNSNKFSSIPAKTSKLQKHATLFGCRQPDIRPPLPHHKPAAADQNVRGATNVSMGSGHNGVSGDMEKHLNAIMEKQPQNMVSLGKHATLPIAIMRCGLSKLLGREASFNNLMHVRVTSSPDLVSKLINAATDSYTTFYKAMAMEGTAVGQHIELCGMEQTTPCMSGEKLQCMNKEICQ
ncbi:unnamed protein product, partial [Closterium sp. NIES-53]